MLSAAKVKNRHVKFGYACFAVPRNFCANGVCVPLPGANRPSDKQKPAEALRQDSYGWDTFLQRVSGAAGLFR